MKKSLLTLLLSSSFILLFAQKHTEVSFDLPTLSNRGALELTFEQQINDRFSMLFGTALDFNNKKRVKTGERTEIVGSDSMVITTNIYDYYNSKDISFFGEMRYYWTPKQGMDRFYVGFGVFYETLLSSEKGYPKDLSDSILAANIPFGYKIVIKDKVIIDLGTNILIGVNNYYSNITNARSRGGIFDMQLNGRVGYRF